MNIPILWRNRIGKRQTRSAKYKPESQASEPGCQGIFTRLRILMLHTFGATSNAQAKDQFPNVVHSSATGWDWAKSIEIELPNYSSKSY